MSEKHENTAENADDKFRLCKESIRKIADKGEPVESIYVEGVTYTLELNNVNLEIYDLFSYWQGDMGPAYGIHIRYTNPEGHSGEDWLGFVGDSEEPSVQFENQDRRPATPNDLKMFESFLQHTKSIVELEEADKERLRQEKQEAEKLRVFKDHIGTVVYHLAKTALDLDDAKARFDHYLANLTLNNAELARQLSDMSDEDLWSLQLRASMNYQHLTLLPHDKERVVRSLRDSIYAVLNTNTSES